MLPVCSECRTSESINLFTTRAESRAAIGRQPRKRARKYCGSVLAKKIANPRGVVLGGPEDVIDCPGQLVDSGVAYLGSSEIGYSPRVRGLRGAGSRSALPLRFSVIFEYGGLIP
jgi:hypothetical protein